MYFKLSFENMKKSIKDYGIYFLTLVLGVAIFYIFNSLDSQQAMLQVSESTRKIIGLMIDLLGIVSVFVSIVLGLLIVYANNFLINRRKKEFGIYMTLGMGKRQISKIILLETIFVGIISLIVGIVIGIFTSQFMSVLVAKLFEADMTDFTFVFSKTACIKTCIYFAVMYLAVMIFNTITISRYKLINLLHANKKNETIKIKNSLISLLVFAVSCVILGSAYYKVTAGIKEIDQVGKLLPPILMGIVSTILIFWSLSGFIMQVVQTLKNTYLKGTNMFVLRQINNKINTTVLSMSVICLMLFMTITILSSSLSIRKAMQDELDEMTPVDLNLYKTANLPDSYTKKNGTVVYYTEEQKADSRTSVSQTLINNGFEMEKLKDIIEIKIYASNNFTWKEFLGDKYENAKKEFPMLRYDTVEEFVKISDYNKIAKAYGNTEYQLEDDEFIVICDFSGIENIRNSALAGGNHEIKISDKIYKSKYNECKEGFILISTSHTNTGLIIVPDSCNLEEENVERYFLSANYNAETKEEEEEINKLFTSDDSGFVQNLANKGIEIDGMTKITIIESSIGIATIVTFIAIYLGIIFLIASAAILALKELTESSDNKQRYEVLRRIGCDEKMINKALFKQIAIFFSLPLILAIIHSIFGIQFVMHLMDGLIAEETLIPSIIRSSIDTYSNIWYIFYSNIFWK